MKIVSILCIIMSVAVYASSDELIIARHLTVYNSYMLRNYIYKDNNDVLCIFSYDKESDTFNVPTHHKTVLKEPRKWLLAFEESLNKLPEVLQFIKPKVDEHNPWKFYSREFNNNIERCESDTEIVYIDKLKYVAGLLDKKQHTHRIFSTLYGQERHDTFEHEAISRGMFFELQDAYYGRIIN